MPTISETGRGQSKGKSAGIESAGDKPSQTFSRALLQSLREAGLQDPVESLDDPRLGKAADQLNGTFVMSLRGHDRVHVWSSSDCHQILTIGLQETRVESAAGTVVETLSRMQGGADEKTVCTRRLPEGEFPDLE
jgi:hypothetical protein